MSPARGQQLPLLLLLARVGWVPIGLSAWAGAPLRLVLTGFAAWGLGAYGTIRAERAGFLPPLWIPLLVIAGILVPLVGLGSGPE